MEKANLRALKIIIVILPGLFLCSAFSAAGEDNLFAYDDLYRAGRYNYIIDTLKGQTDDVKLVKARVLASLGDRSGTLNQLSLLDGVYPEAAALYFRYGELTKAKEISIALPTTGGFSDLVAGYIIAISAVEGEAPELNDLPALLAAPLMLFSSAANLRLADRKLADKDIDSAIAYLDNVAPGVLSLDDEQKYHFLKSKIHFKKREYELALNQLKAGLSARRFIDHKQAMTDFAVDSLYPNLNDEQVMELINLLRQIRFYDEAIKILDLIEPSDSLILIKAWCYFGKKQYLKASEIFQRLDESNDPDLRAEAIYGRGASEYRRGRRLNGVKIMLEFAKTYPDDPLAARALFTAADFYQKSNPDKSAGILKTLTDYYNDSQYYTRALFLLGKTYHKLGLNHQAQQVYSSYNKNDDLADLFDFWLYKTMLTDSTRLERIIDRNNSSFYNYKARQQLGDDIPDSTPDYDDFMTSFLNMAETYLSLIGKLNGAIDTRLSFADSLYRYGLENEAGRHLLFIHNQNANLNADLALLRKCRELNLDWAFFDILEDFKLSLKRQGFSFSHETWQRLDYPVLFNQALAYHAGKKIDPYLALAVIRRESRFDPMAISSVGALGLMQLMPLTASQMAGNEGDPREWIFEPGYNIRLGCKYLRWLEVRLKRKEVVVAAYNAGPTAAKKWLKQADSSPETYIETVGYDQSRNYARGVIGDYYWYKYLWPAQFSN